MTDVDRARELLGRTPFVLLTTFRRDGRLVPTPVWVAPLDEERIVLVTRDSTGKVKRVRREPRVLLAPCGRLGKPLGRLVDGRAAVLDERELPAVERALAAEDGWQFRVLDAVEGLAQRRGRVSGRRVAVALTVTGP